MSDNLISRRNTAAVEQQIRAMDENMRAQQIRIDGLVSSMSTLMERLGTAEQTVNMLRARLMGTGPTT